jgi:hypothetical protein
MGVGAFMFFVFDIDFSRPLLPTRKGNPGRIAFSE